jgi:hypothetical protein
MATHVPSVSVRAPVSAHRPSAVPKWFFRSLLVPDNHSSPPILVILSRTMTSDYATNGSDDKFFTLTATCTRC